MVRPRGSPVSRKRSPMAFNMASGQPSPDEELTETVAPFGIAAAASFSETRLDRAITRSYARSIAGNLDCSTGLCRFAHRQSHCQRSDTVDPTCRRLPLAPHSRVEVPHRSFVEILVFY